MRLHLRAPLFFVIFGALVCYPIDSEQKSQDADRRIRVAVEMVSLPVVATTRGGKHVTDLQKEDFQVFEDKIEQEIAGFSPTEEPFSIALLLDTSGSTKQRLARFQNEAIRFVNLLHPDDSVAILSFSEDVQLHEDFSIDRDRNARGIKETRPGGSTVLYEGVWLALEEVLKPVQERKALVLFTDGVDTASRLVSRKETIELSKETRAAIYVVYINTQWDTRQTGPTVGGFPMPGPPIGVGPRPRRSRYPGGSRRGYAAGHRYLLELAENSGGKVFDAKAMEDLGPSFEQIARELASQYSIGYYSSNPKRDGKFRKIQVKIKKPGIVARTKKGYYAH